MKKLVLAIAALALIGSAAAFAATAPAPAVKTLAGVIKSVQAADAAKKLPEAVFVTVGEGKAAVVDEVLVGAKTVIKGLDGKAVAFKDLKAGEKVSVKYVVVAKAMNAAEIDLVK